jgi:hypothetical protein
MADETPDRIAETRLHVAGVHTEAQVVEALQALYDVFAQLSLGGATFETSDAAPAVLIVKHKQSVTPDVAAISAALAQAGDYRVVD